MIGLDTNILVRYFVKDDPPQTSKAVSLIYALSPEEPGWVGLAVLVELVWVLTRTYRVDRPGVIRILDTLSTSREIVLEQEDTVRNALRLFGRRNTDFADCLIASSAKAAGCSQTATFDRKAARDTGMELVG